MIPDRGMEWLILPFSGAEGEGALEPSQDRVGLQTG